MSKSAWLGGDHFLVLAKKNRWAAGALLIILLMAPTSCGEKTDAKSKPVPPIAKTEPAKKAAEASPAAKPQPPVVVPPKPPEKKVAYIEVTTIPSGATVTLGHPLVNGITTPGTGRYGGVSPCKIEIKLSDLDSKSGLTVQADLPGYFPSIKGLGDATRKLTEGGTHPIQFNMMKRP